MTSKDWKWYGHPAHFVCSEDCRFHLTTLVGNYVVSTVGELFFDSEVRETLARSRGIQLEGRGDARRADWLHKNGYEDIGLDRKYETMVFRWSGKVCDLKGCDCGLPEISLSELDSRGYNNAGDATRGHYELCETWDTR